MKDTTLQVITTAARKHARANKARWHAAEYFSDRRFDTAAAKERLAQQNLQTLVREALCAGYAAEDVQAAIDKGETS